MFLGFYFKKNGKESLHELKELKIFLYYNNKYKKKFITTVMILQF